MKKEAISQDSIRRAISQLRSAARHLDRASEQCKEDQAWRFIRAAVHLTARIADGLEHGKTYLSHSLSDTFDELNFPGGVIEHLDQKDYESK